MDRLSLDSMAWVVREATGAAGLAPFRVADRERRLPESWLAVKVAFSRQSGKGQLELFVPGDSALAHDFAALGRLSETVLGSVLPYGAESRAYHKVSAALQIRLKARRVGLSQLPPRGAWREGCSMLFVDTDEQLLGVALTLQRPSCARMPCFSSFA